MKAKDCVGISVLIPTRKRPTQLLRLLKSIDKNTKNHCNIELIIYIDCDDSSYEGLQIPPRLNAKIIRGPTNTMGALNIKCLDAASGDVYILFNDDLIIRTYGWDDRVQKIHGVYSDGIYLAYGDDCHKGHALCTFPIFSRSLRKLIHKPFPEEYKRYFIDTHLMDIFLRLKYAGFNRIIYDSELIFEHIHWRARKSNLDQVYINGLKMRFLDDLVFIQNINSRNRSCDLLLSKLTGKATDKRGNYRDKKISKIRVLRLLQIIIIMFGDFKIPLPRRFYLCIYFVIRDFLKINSITRILNFTEKILIKKS